MCSFSHVVVKNCHKRSAHYIPHLFYLGGCYLVLPRCSIFHAKEGSFQLYVLKRLEFHRTRVLRVWFSGPFFPFSAVLFFVYKEAFGYVRDLLLLSSSLLSFNRLRCLFSVVVVFELCKGLVDVVSFVGLLSPPLPLFYLDGPVQIFPGSLDFF